MMHDAFVERTEQTSNEKEKDSNQATHDWIRIATQCSSECTASAVTTTAVCLHGL
jgi:hypothetical protein